MHFMGYKYDQSKKHPVHLANTAPRAGPGLGLPQRDGLPPVPRPQGQPLLTQVGGKQTNEQTKDNKHVFKITHLFLFVNSLIRTKYIEKINKVRTI